MGLGRMIETIRVKAIRPVMVGGQLERSGSVPVPQYGSAEATCGSLALRTVILGREYVHV
jgi:hypothetical protein